MHMQTMMHPMATLMNRQALGWLRMLENFAAPKPRRGNHKNEAEIAPKLNSHLLVTPYWLAIPPIMTRVSM